MEIGKQKLIREFPFPCKSRLRVFLFRHYHHYCTIATHPGNVVVVSLMARGTAASVSSPLSAAVVRVHARCAKIGDCCNRRLPFVVGLFHATERTHMRMTRLPSDRG